MGYSIKSFFWSSKVKKLLPRVVLISKNTITCQISVLRNKNSATFITEHNTEVVNKVLVIKVAEHSFLSIEIWHVMVFFEIITTLGDNFFTLLYQKRTLFSTPVLCSLIKVAEYSFLSTEIWHMMVFFEMSTTLITDFFTLLSQKKDFVLYPRPPKSQMWHFLWNKAKLYFFYFIYQKYMCWGYLGPNMKKIPPWEVWAILSWNRP